MALYRATVKLPRVSGVTADDVINVWHFSLPTPTIILVGIVAAALGDFYQEISDRYSAAIDRNADACSVAMALVTNGGVGSGGSGTVSAPELVLPFQMSRSIPSGTQPLPAEVASALSFHGSYAGLAEEVGNTRPRSRRRGRVFLGPFNSSVLTADPSTNEGVPGLVFRGEVISSYVDHIEVLPNTTASHVIYSPTLAAATPVTQIWMDNAWDTIRSRGQLASARDTAQVSN